LEYVHDKLVVVSAIRNGTRGGGNRSCGGGVEPSKLSIGFGGGPFNQSEGFDKYPGKAPPAHREILGGQLGLPAVKAARFFHELWNVSQQLQDENQTSRPFFAGKFPPVAKRYS
jgi:hypothetical protein